MNFHVSFENVLELIRYMYWRKKNQKIALKYYRKKSIHFRGWGVICIENSVFENVLTFREFRKCIGKSMPPPGSKPENVLKTFLKGHVNFLIHSPNMWIGCLAVNWWLIRFMFDWSAFELFLSPLRNSVNKHCTVTPQFRNFPTLQASSPKGTFDHLFSVFEALFLLSLPIQQKHRVSRGIGDNETIHRYPSYYCLTWVFAPTKTQKCVE